MRQILECSLAEEHELINKLGIMLRNAGFNASNSTLVAVSSDYSSIAWQILRHFLSHDGEVCDGFTVDVPYPDEAWSGEFERLALQACKTVFFRDNLILIEAGVIRGSNYRRMCDLIHENFPGQVIVTSTVFENVHSTFKSDFVVKFYDDETQDLTFWWEAYNKHWPIDIQERKRLASKAVWGSGLGGCGNLGFDPDGVPAPMINRNQVFHAGLDKAATASSSVTQIVDEATGSTVDTKPLVGTRLVTPMILVDENDINSHGSHCPGMAIIKDDAVDAAMSRLEMQIWDEATGSEEPARCVGMQGTSMETPRLAGELALLVGWLKRFERVLGVEAKQPEPPEPEVRG